MDFDYSPRQREWMARLGAFMDAHVYPAEALYAEQLDAMAAQGLPWRVIPVMEELKAKARAAGLWNLFLNDSPHGAGLSNLDYSPLAEMMGRVIWSPEVFNCTAPDTGNMEILERYGTPEQQERWLAPLLAGEIRSGFGMTEPGVASSDATNIRTSIVRDGDDYVINGRKWWTSGSLHPNCKLLIIMGVTDPDGERHRRQSQILVPIDTPGVTIVRPLSSFGFGEVPFGHSEILLENVRVPATNILLGENRGFEIAQGRLGPGRIHHCMRSIGAAERALELMCRRLSSRTAFGKSLHEHSIWEQRIAEARINIDMCRLLTLNAADKMDKLGNKAARTEIGEIKVAAPRMALKVIDDAIQAFGAAGVGPDTLLPKMFVMQRELRIGDGPDEVHCRSLARAELAKYAGGAAA
jgi:alkylation response protein AidB-like acyl-CoA dehydrogenase